MGVRLEGQVLGIFIAFGAWGVWVWDCKLKASWLEDLGNWGWV